MSSVAFMTTAEYAAHRGCSDSFVRRLKRQHRLVLGPDGKLIDVAQSDALLDATSDPLRGGKRDPDDALPPADSGDKPQPPLVAGPTIKEAVRRERLARARKAELELGEAAGDLARRHEVNRAVFTLVRQALERMRTMGSRLKRRLAVETDPAVCEAIITKEIEEICGDMQLAAEDLRRGGDAVEGEIERVA